MTKLIQQHPARATAVLIALALAVIALAVSGNPDYRTLEFKPVTVDSVVDLLTPILLVALFVERALEVFVSTGRKLGRSDKERALQKAKTRLEQLDQRLKVFQSQLDAPGAVNLPPQDREKIHERMQNVASLIPDAQRAERKAESEFEKYRGYTRIVSFVVGALLGLIIALAGIRVVVPLVEIDPAQWSGFQAFVFHGLDVVLTAGLLAGGASGIHEIISVFADFSAQTRRRAQAG